MECTLDFLKYIQIPLLIVHCHVITETLICDLKVLKTCIKLVLEFFHVASVIHSYRYIK